MSQKEKLIRRFKQKPKDFTFGELEKLLNYFGYIINNSGKTSGSRVTFVHPIFAPIKCHKPHPDCVPEYLINQILTVLEERKQI